MKLRAREVLVGVSLRDGVLTVVRGGRAEQVPFTCYLGLAPEEALGIESMALVTSCRLFVEVLPEVRFSSQEVAAGVTRQEMETPWGCLTRLVETEQGYGSGWVREHWIKGPADYAVVEQLVRNTKLEPDPHPYRAARHKLRDRGVVLGRLPRAPLQRLWIEYTGMERLAYDLADAPAAVEGLLDAFVEQSVQALEIAASSEAELIWFPDNVTADMTGPSWFKRYLAPYYGQGCQVLLAAGKTPCTHMDGRLAGIAACVADTPLPVIEALTPPPDGDLSVRRARQAWPGKTLWLNFPSSVHLAPPRKVAAVTRQLVEEAGDCSGFLIGITENIPASVGAQSLRAIAAVLT